MLVGVEHGSKQPSKKDAKANGIQKINYIKIKSFGYPLHYSRSFPIYYYVHWCTDVHALLKFIIVVNDDDGTFIFYSSSYKLYNIHNIYLHTYISIIIIIIIIIKPYQARDRSLCEVVNYYRGWWWPYKLKSFA